MERTNFLVLWSCRSVRARPRGAGAREEEEGQVLRCAEHDAQAPVPPVCQIFSRLGPERRWLDQVDGEEPLQDSRGGFAASVCLPCIRLEGLSLVCWRQCFVFIVPRPVSCQCIGGLSLLTEKGAESLDEPQDHHGNRGVTRGCELSRNN